MASASTRGVGFIASSNPAAGDNEWHRPVPADTLPTGHSNVQWLVVCDDRDRFTGWRGVWKTDGIGPGPYVWQPVVTDGAESAVSWLTLSIQEFKGKLYVGSDRPTELIRINSDDTWDLVVGGPRWTPTGFKRPISGLLTGFGNLFNGHFWRMATHSDTLFLGTWDWSVSLRGAPNLEPLFRHEFGADFFKTTDGRYWQPVTKTGFGDPFNYGVRTLQSTPAGLFVGTANPFYGAQVWRTTDVTATASDTSPSSASQGPGSLPGDGLAAVSPGKKRSIATSDESGTDRFTGSLTRTAPGGMVAVWSPPKVSARSDPAAIAVPLPRSARWAPSIVRALVPKALVNTTRTRSPPMLIRTNCRNVWLLKRSAGNGSPLGG